MIDARKLHILSGVIQALREAVDTQTDEPGWQLTPEWLANVGAQYAARILDSTRAEFEVVINAVLPLVEKE